MVTHEFRTFPTDDGDLAVEIVGTSAGERPLIVCLPGMGDLRSGYRHLVPLLTAEGFRVALVDLPGHGDSAAGAVPSQRRIAAHVVEIVRALGGRAIVVGHSYTPDSALLATQLAPELVVGAVCIGPWAGAPVTRGVGALLASTVARSPLLWGVFLRSLHRIRPADLDEHVLAIRRSLRRPNGTATIVRMAGGAGKDAIDARDTQVAPTIVVMGERDPDFRDPLAEAEAFASPFGGDVRMVPGAGHYPHAETPATVAELIIELAARHPAATDA